MALLRFFSLLALLVSFIGLSTSLSGCAMVAAYPVTAASVATTAATGKGPTDHALSESMDKDCSVWKVFDGQPICERRLKPHEVPVQDYSKKKKVVPAN